MISVELTFLDYGEFLRWSKQVKNASEGQWDAHMRCASHSSESKGSVQNKTSTRRCQLQISEGNITTPIVSKRIEKSYLAAVKLA